MVGGIGNGDDVVKCGVIVEIYWLIVGFVERGSGISEVFVLMFWYYCFFEKLFGNFLVECC